MKIVTTESLPTLADNKTSITCESAANFQGAKFELTIDLAFANLIIGQSLICLAVEWFHDYGYYIQHMFK